MADGNHTGGHHYSAGKTPVEADNMMNQPLSPKDERIVSTNPSPDAVITGPPRNVMDPPRSSDAAADNNSFYPLNTYGSLEQTYFYGGYDGGTSSWSGYPQYAGAEGLHIVPPVIYGDNPSIGLHSPYGFNSQMAYGQYSPVSTPVPQIMVDNQLFSPQQIPVSPQYYPQPVGSSMPHMSAAIPVSHNEMVTPKGHMSGNTGHSHGYYNMHGMFGSGEPLSGQSNAADVGWRPLTSTAGYSQPVGALGSFDPTVGQMTQQRTFPGYGLASDFIGGPYSYDGLFQSSTYGGVPNSPGANYRSRVNLEKARNQREQDSIFVVSGDRNRGPRASKAKGKGTNGNGLLPGTESAVENSSSGGTAKVGDSTSGLNLASYNNADFPTEYEDARFFIIKSFSEDNIHRSIKYGVWASTPHGNRKLDAAFHEAKEKGNCPVFLLFSVNASGQFCGVAEMTGPVDFEKNADYWQQDRWTGQFTARWHIVKDVPNSKFRHILLENNDNKPVTHSRDSQEVKLEQGIEMLKIFKEYEAQTSILDDFEFYDEREKVLQERKSRQQASKTKAGVPESISDEMLNNITDRLDQALHLDETCKDVVANEKGSGVQTSSKP